MNENRKQEATGGNYNRHPRLVDVPTIIGPLYLSVHLRFMWEFRIFLCYLFFSLKHLIFFFFPRYFWFCIQPMAVMDEEHCLAAKKTFLQSRKDSYQQGSERVRSLEIEQTTLRGPERPEAPLGFSATPSWTRSLSKFKFKFKKLIKIHEMMKQ